MKLLTILGMINTLCIILGFIMNNYIVVFVNTIAAIGCLFGGDE